ncbi:MAG TPA: hypothetical protein VL545_13905, partial [Rhodanobacter sp.]|nr:hypothetical protein [Rhodanobacter sp.]
MAALLEDFQVAAIKKTAMVWRFGVVVSISSKRSRPRRRRWLRIAVKPEIQAGGGGMHGDIDNTMDV